MKHLFLFIFSYYLLEGLSAQNGLGEPNLSQPSKPPIDSGGIYNWVDLLWSEPVITKDGRYFMYGIDNLPAGNSTLVIQETEGTWKKEIIGASRGFFSGNSKQALFKISDTLYIFPLGREEPVVIPQVVAYKQPTCVTPEWISYEVKSDNSEIILRNLYTGKEQQFRQVTDYRFDNAGKVLLLKTKNKRQSIAFEEIKWISLTTSRTYIVWSNLNNDHEKTSLSNFQFDENAKQLAFIVDNITNKGAASSIWYYKEGSESAVMKANEQSPGIAADMMISNNTPTFSKNGNYIFFKIQPKTAPILKPNPDAVQVDVWSYTDMVLQYTQLRNLQKRGAAFMPKTKFAAVMPTSGNIIIRLEQEDEGIKCGFNGKQGYVVVAHQKYKGDKSWLREPVSNYLVSLKDGFRKFLTSDQCDFSFYPNGEFLVYYNYENRNYFSYNLLNGETLNISKLIPTRLTNEDNDERTNNNRTPVGMAGWLQNKSLLIYDNNDIWMVDLGRKKEPVNLTNGYGALNHIRFKVLQDIGLKEDQFYPNDKPIYLTGFNTINKYNGFFAINPCKTKAPQALCFGPYNYYTEGSQANGLQNMKPVKAEGRNVWIIKRQTASDAPNLFFTKDFKRFSQLTNIQPQVKYNWFTTELITWQQSSGISCQGILYKPDNFDSNNKYPVIVNYYEKRSQNLYQFLQPNFTGGDLNIPWYVSRGYLVFTPDIHYTIGKTGKSVVNSVVSGVRHLFGLSFVDSTRVGIQGHSFGGYETNYLVTQTDIFAAAAEGAGPSDWISNYGSLLPYEQSTVTSHFEESGQNRIEATIWDNRDEYIENSPIFYADKVTTPLLIMHNKNDDAVPWIQAVELFIALRRLDKKAWMLQYDNGGHGLSEKDARDYTLRLTQFFDHYLKAAPPPKWMTVSIPAKIKGLEMGLNLDFPGSCGNCPVCNKNGKK